jgi:hypothetical protein
MTFGLIMVACSLAWWLVAATAHSRGPGSILWRVTARLPLEALELAAPGAPAALSRIRWLGVPLGRLRARLVFVQRDAADAESLIAQQLGCAVAGFWLITGVFRFVSDGAPVRGGSTLLFWLGLCLLAGLVGWWIPRWRLNLMVADERERTLQRFPRLLQLLALSLQAGAEFDYAFERLAGQLRGTLRGPVLLAEAERDAGVRRDIWLDRMCRRSLGWEDVYESAESFQPQIESLRQRDAYNDLILLSRAISRSGELGTVLATNLIATAERLQRDWYRDVEARGQRGATALTLPTMLMVMAMTLMVAVPMFASIAQIITLGP